MVRSNMQLARIFQYRPDVTISGTGTQGASLQIEGNGMFVAPAGKFKTSGSLGGRHVAVLVPEA